MIEPQLSPLLKGLLAAVEAVPGEVALRAHVAEALLAQGHTALTLAHVGAGLAAASGDPVLLELLRSSTLALAGPPPSAAAPLAAPPKAAAGDGDFDWSSAESELGIDVPRRSSMTPPANSSATQMSSVPASRLPTWWAWSTSKSASSWRSSPRCATRNAARCTARPPAVDCCSTARRAAGRPIWPGRSPASLARTSWRPPDWP